MNWFQLALLIINLLRELKNAKSEEAFCTSASAQALPVASGDLLKWLWENREEIIEFVKVIVGMFGQQDQPSIQSSLDDLLK